MEIPQWKACMCYFKHQFSACLKCQSGHSSPEAMLVHLTASHFCQEALLAFGSDLTCLVCSEKLSSHKESYKEYYILSHMAGHLDQFAPAEAKKILCSQETMKTNEIKEKCPTTIVEKKLEQDSRRKGHKVPTSRVTSFKSQEMTKNIMACKLNLPWQECEKYFRNMYPTCKFCNKGHKTSRNLRRHLIFMHYSDRAMERFGKGKTCAMCKNYEVRATADKYAQITLIKGHMVSHLAQLVPDIDARHLLVKADAKRHNNRQLKPIQKISKVPHLSRCEAFFKQTFADCAMCQRATYKNAFWLKQHLFEVHYRDRILKAFDRRRNVCLICHGTHSSIKSNYYRTSNIVRHFMKHHLDLMIGSLDSAEAREVLAEAFRRNPQPNNHRRNTLSASELAKKKTHKNNTHTG